MWKWLFGDSYSISREEFLSHGVAQQATQKALWDSIKEQNRVIKIQTDAIVNLSQRIQELERVVKSYEKPY